MFRNFTDRSSVYTCSNEKVGQGDVGTRMARCATAQPGSIGNGQCGGDFAPRAGSDLRPDGARGGTDRITATPHIDCVGPRHAAAHDLNPGCGTQARSAQDLGRRTDRDAGAADGLLHSVPAFQQHWGGVVGYVATRNTTATKTDTPIVNIPQQVTVLTKQFLDDQAFQNQPMPRAMRPASSRTRARAIAIRS